MDEWITVEEASQIVERSHQTIRRWCRDKRIAATKSGRDWLIDPRSLPKPRRKRTPTTTPSLDVALAWDHVVAHDLKQDTWVPDPLGFADFIDSPQVVIDEARSALRGQYVPEILDRIGVPKTELLNRNAAMPALKDRVVYQAAIGSFAERIEAQTTPAVFSARLSTNKKYFLEKSTDAHGRFQRRTREAVENGYNVLVIADVASYFDNIQHRLLFAQVQGLNPNPDAARILGEMLRHWDLGGGAGIPQGPNASRVLGNLYLLPVDLAVQSAALDVIYLRFQDDIRIAGKTRADAIRAFHVVETELRRLALTPVAKKTHLLTTQKEVDELLGDPRKDAINYMMSLGLIDAPRKELRKMLDRALKETDGPGAPDVRFSLWRLAQLRDSARLTKVLNRLDSLAPFGSLIAAFLIPFLAKPRTLKALGEYLCDGSRNLSSFMPTWLLAALVEAPRVSSDIESHARQVAQDRNSHRYLRGTAAVVIARHGNDADRRWLENELRDEPDPFLARAFMVALRHRGPLNKAVTSQAVRRHPDLKLTVDFLNGRDRLPSMVYANRVVRVP